MTIFKIKRIWDILNLYPQSQSVKKWMVYSCLQKYVDIRSYYLFVILYGMNTQDGKKISPKTEEETGIQTLLMRLDVAIIWRKHF